MRQIEVNVFTPIRNIKFCRKLEIPFKRGIVFHGEYGTGKSLTARVAMRMANENGITAIMSRVTDPLARVISLAKQYSPSIVIFEDIDRVATDSNTSLSGLLDVMDGVLAKGTEVMTIFTTNHVENISNAFLRPGRLDAAIYVGLPDFSSVERLIRRYSRGLVDKKENITEAVQKCEGMIPATIREVVERSKLYAMPRGETETLKVTCQDLVLSAESMKDHLNLMKKGAKEERKVRVLLETEENSTTLLPGGTGVVKTGEAKAGDTKASV